MICVAPEFVHRKSACGFHSQVEENVKKNVLEKRQHCARCSVDFRSINVCKMVHLTVLFMSLLAIVSAWECGDRPYMDIQEHVLKNTTISTYGYHYPSLPKRDGGESVVIYVTARLKGLHDVDAKLNMATISVSFHMARFGREDLAKKVQISALGRLPHPVVARVLRRHKKRAHAHECCVVTANIPLS